MRLAAYLVLYVLAVFVVGALLAYPLHLALEMAGAEAPFHKLVLRVLKLLALLGLWPLLVALGTNTRASWGYAIPRRRFALAFARGLAVGVAMLAVLVAMLIGAGLRLPDPAVELAPVWLAMVLAEAALAGVAVAFIEESWFRGALYTAIASRGSAAAAVALTALLYSAVHFVKADVPVPAAELAWWSGLEVIGGAFGRFSDPRIVDSALALLAAGVFLAMVRHRTGHVAECIGIHAGWVIVIKITREATVLDRDAPFPALVGGYDGVIGYLALAWLGVCCVAYYGLSSRAEASVTKRTEGFPPRGGEGQGGGVKQRRVR